LKKQFPDKGGFQLSQKRASLQSGGGAGFLAPSQPFPRLFLLETGNLSLETALVRDLQGMSYEPMALVR
jgi:hypothetical protein